MQLVAIYIKKPFFSTYLLLRLPNLFFVGFAASVAGSYQTLSVANATLNVVFYILFNNKIIEKVTNKLRAIGCNYCLYLARSLFNTVMKCIKTNNLT